MVDEIMESKVDLTPEFRNLSDEHCQLLKNELENSFIKKNTAIDTRPFESSDFSEAITIAKASLLKLADIFCDSETEDFSESSTPQRECIDRIIILCGEHSSSNVWTDDECIELAVKVLPAVLRFCHCETLSTYLLKSDRLNRLHAGNLFTIIMPKLHKGNWKYHPSMLCCLSFLLHYIEVPYFKQFLHLVLPLSLDILEDYATTSKIMGLTLLYHILTNVAGVELQWHIQIEVLQNILRKLLYYKETELIVPVISCALQVAEKSQSNFKQNALNLKWSYYDEILNIVLPLIEFEQNVDRRMKYGIGLCVILKSCNFLVVRWMAKILRIIEDYCKCNFTELEGIMALKLLLQSCWPVAKNHWKKINVIAGKIIFNSDNAKAIKEAEICIYLLKQIVPSDTPIVEANTIKIKKILQLLPSD